MELNLDFAQLIYATTAFSGWFTAQTIKVLLNLILRREGKLSPRYFFASGGIPSVHASFVSSVVLVIGLIEGFDSPIFAVGLVLLGVVIYDAIGVRRATGENTQAIRSILWQSQYKYDNQRLSSHLGRGHTAYQVVVGLLIGGLCGLGNYLLFGVSTPAAS